MKTPDFIVIKKKKSPVAAIVIVACSVVAAAAAAVVVYKLYGEKIKTFACDVKAKVDAKLHNKTKVLGAVDIDGDGEADALILDTTGDGEVDTIILNDVCEVCEE